jgi:hypothetical protein
MKPHHNIIRKNCAPITLDDPFFETDISQYDEYTRNSSEYDISEGDYDDLESYWKSSGLAEKKNLDNNADSAAERLETLPAANTNQPLLQVDNMSVKNTCANNSTTTSKSDVCPQENSDSQNPPKYFDDIPDSGMQAGIGNTNRESAHTQKGKGVDNAALSHNRADSKPFTSTNYLIKPEDISIEVWREILLNHLTHLFTCDIKTWGTSLTALHSLLGSQSFDLAHEISAVDPRYEKSETTSQWNYAKKKKVSAGFFINELERDGLSLSKLARQYSNESHTTSPVITHQKPENSRENHTSDYELMVIYNKTLPSLPNASINHPYLKQKGFKSVPNGVKVTTKTIKFSSKNYIKSNTLIVPVNHYKTGVTIGYQRIDCNEKRNLKGGKKTNGAIKFGLEGNEVMLTESLSTSDTVYQALGTRTWGCFGIDGVVNIAKQLISDGVIPKHITIAIDNDPQHKKRLDILRKVESLKKQGVKTFIPEKEGTDWNDVGVEGCKQAYQSLFKPKAPAPFDDMDMTLIRSKYIENYKKHLDLTTLPVKSIIVRAGTGSGKSTAIAEEISRALVHDKNAYFIIVVPRARLAESLAKSLTHDIDPKKSKFMNPDVREHLIKLGINKTAYCYEEVKNLSQKQRQEKGITIVITTIDSLYYFPDFFEGENNLNGFFMDESEEVFSQLSSVTKDVQKAIKCMRDTFKCASQMFLMDAHASDRTRYLYDLISPEDHRRIDEKAIYLNGTYKKWSDHTLNIVTHEKYKKARAKTVRLMMNDISKNKRIGVPCLTAKEAVVMANILSAEFPELKVGCVVGKKDKHLANKKLVADAIINEKDLVKQYDIIVFSPVIGMGVSFDILQHINCIYCFAESLQNAPTAKGVMQMLARFRNLIDKTITISLDQHQLSIDNINVKEYRKLIVNIINKNRSKNKEIKVEYKEISDFDKLEIDLKVKYKELEIIDKSNFYDQVIKMCEHDFTKENINYVEVGDSESENLEVVIKAERSRLREIDKKVTFECFLNPISELKMRDIAIKTLKDRESVTHKEFMQLSVGRKLRSLGMDEKTSVDDLMIAEELYSKDLIGTIYNNENADMTVKETNRFLAAITYGLGESLVMKGELINRDINIKVLRSFYSVLREVAVYGVIKKKDNPKIKKLMNLIHEKNKELKISGVATNGYMKDIEKKARLWLKSYLGYTINRKQTRKEGKREWEYTAKPNADIVHLCDLRKTKEIDKTSTINKLVAEEHGEVFLRMTSEIEVEVFPFSPAHKRDFNLAISQSPECAKEMLTDLYIRKFRESKPESINGINFYVEQNDIALAAINEKIIDLKVI